MKGFRFLLGLLLLVLGLGYLYRPYWIVKLNAWVRMNIFNDQILITRRRKVGIILFFIGVILIFLGLTG